MTASEFVGLAFALVREVPGTPDPAAHVCQRCVEGGDCRAAWVVDRADERVVAGAGGGDEAAAVETALAARRGQAVVEGAYATVPAGDERALVVERAGGFDDAERVALREVGEALADAGDGAEDATAAERERHRKLRELHEAAGDLQRAESTDDIAEVAVRTARDVLDCPLTGLWLYDPEAEALVPLAMTDRADETFDEIPRFERGEAIAWEVYDSGEPAQFGDVSEQADAYNPETPVRAELVVPLGDHGALTMGRTERGEFDDVDVELMRVLCASVEAALDRADREQLLRERERELGEQNDRLAFLNALLRHEILNGMMVITNYVEFLDDHVDEEGREYLSTVEEYGEEIAALVEKVQAVLRTLTEERSLASYDLSSVLDGRVERLRATHPEATVHADVERGLAVESDDLLGGVLWNVLVNAVEHNDGHEPTVWVAAERRDDTAVVRVVDDGPGIDDDLKERVLERDVTGSDLPGGSGFGLYFVATMVERYGGTIRVEDAETGGATVVVELPLAKRPE
jgi:signal transduction histidine kinase